MKRIGTVLIFKKEVTKEQAQEALDKLRDLLDPTYWTYPQRPYSLHEFNDEYGGPVWYIP